MMAQSFSLFLGNRITIKDRATLLGTQQLVLNSFIPTLEYYTTNNKSPENNFHLLTESKIEIW